MGLRLALRRSYELIILEVTIPTLDGLDVLRQRSDVPVIMLTARTSQRDRIAGLESGADDYRPRRSTRAGCSRKKLESAGHPLIRTVRGAGYMFLAE